MTFNQFYQKIINRIWGIIVKNTKDFFLFPYLYKSYWNFLFKKQHSKNIFINYYSAQPNPGAGIGHQMANWIAGFWYAKQFGLNYAYSNFSNNKWDDFLGFGIGEIKVSDLKKNGYKIVKLPLFDEFNFKEIKIQKKIISSYLNNKVVFISEIDQGYKDQFGVIDTIKHKFYSSPSRKFDYLIYDTNNYNIAIHIRRGDIVIGKQNNESNILLRWQDNNYFLNVLENVLNSINTCKPIHIYIFSQGVESDYKAFLKFSNVNFCLNMNEQSSFLHMVFSDLLITSKSSFSYKPALLNNGIKVCPKEFWHGYPNTNDWIMADESGELLIENLILINE